MRFVVGQKWRGQLSGLLFEVVAAHGDLVEVRYVEGYKAGEGAVYVAAELCADQVVEPLSVPRLPRPGETWRLKDGGRLIEDLREDGCLLFSRDNLPYTADWLAVNAVLVSEAPPTDPLAGIDWSKYLPKDGDARSDQGTAYKPGDICAARWGEGHRTVFRVEHCNHVGIGGVVLAPVTPGQLAQRCTFAAGFAVQIGLIARDGKLVAQPVVIQAGANETVPQLQQRLKEAQEPAVMVPVKVGAEIRHIPVTAAEPMQSPRLPPFAEMVLRHQELAGIPLLTDAEVEAMKVGSVFGTGPQKMENRRLPKPIRAHDFSNPYLRDWLGNKLGFLCVECGCCTNFRGDGCDPKPGWREEEEKQIAKEMRFRESAKSRAGRYDHKPPPAPYRNDVAGIGARLGGYLNVAPERGR